MFSKRFYFWSMDDRSESDIVVMAEFLTLGVGKKEN